MQRSVVRLFPCTSSKPSVALVEDHEAELVRAAEGDDLVTVRLESPFDCPGFTLSFTASQPVTGISMKGTNLKRVPRGQRLDPGTWTQVGETVWVCLDVAGDTRFIVSF